MTKGRQHLSDGGGQETGHALYDVPWAAGVSIVTVLIPADGKLHTVQCSTPLDRFAHPSGGVGFHARDLVVVTRAFLVLVNDEHTPEAGLRYRGSVYVPDTGTSLHLMEKRL